MPLVLMGPSAAANAAPRCQRVLDALRCILRLIWTLNELFQMKILPVLRKQFTFFSLSWCAGLSACGTLALQQGSGGQKPEGSRCSEMHSQPYLRPFFLVCRAVWPELNYFFSWSQSLIIFFHWLSGLNYFFQRISGHDYFFQFYTHYTCRKRGTTLR